MSLPTIHWKKKGVVFGSSFAYTDQGRFCSNEAKDTRYELFRLDEGWKQQGLASLLEEERQIGQPFQSLWKGQREAGRYVF